MFVLVMILLIFKICCEQNEITRAYFNGNSNFLKLLSTPRGYSFLDRIQPTEKNNKQQTNKISLIDEDLEFSLEKCNKILLDNRDAEFIGQGKGIKRFAQECITGQEVLKEYNEESSVGSVSNQEGIKPKCVDKCSTGSSLITDRKKRQVFHKNKFKKLSNKSIQNVNNFNNHHKIKSCCSHHNHYSSHKRDLSSSDLASDLSAKRMSYYGDHDRMDISEYRPDYSIDQNMNTDNKQRKPNNEPPISSDDYAHDTDLNQIHSSNKNNKSFSILEPNLSTQDTSTGITTGNMLHNLIFPHINKTSIFVKTTTNIPDVSVPTIQINLNDKNIKNSGKAKNDDRSQNFTSTAKYILNTNSQTRSTLPMTLTDSGLPANITIPVKKGMTEDSCVSLLEQSSIDENVVELTGGCITAINQITEGKNFSTSILKNLGETFDNTKTGTSLPAKVDTISEIKPSTKSFDIVTSLINEVNYSKFDKSTINKRFLETSGISTETNLDSTSCEPNGTGKYISINVLMDKLNQSSQYPSNALRTDSDKSSGESVTNALFNIFNFTEQSYISNITNFTLSDDTTMPVNSSFFSFSINNSLQSTLSLSTDNVNIKTECYNITVMTPMTNSTSDQDFRSFPDQMPLYTLASTFSNNSLLATTASLSDIWTSQNLSLQEDKSDNFYEGENITDQANLSTETNPGVDSNPILTEFKATDSFNVESRTFQVNDRLFSTLSPGISPTAISSPWFGVSDDLNYCLSLFCMRDVFNQTTVTNTNRETLSKLNEETHSKFTTYTTAKAKIYSTHSPLPEKNHNVMTKNYKFANNVPTIDPCLPQERKGIKSKAKAPLDSVTPKSIYYAFHINKTSKEHEKYSLRFVSGIQHTTKSVGHLHEIVRKINNTINKVKKGRGSTKSPIIKLTHHQQEATPTISVIKKMLGLPPKNTKVKSLTDTSKHFVIPEECMTLGPKGNKAHPFRHKGGDPGNHYLHGKPKLINSESTASTVEYTSQFSSYSNETTWSTDETKSAETEEPFIPRVKGNPSKLLNTSYSLEDSTMCPSDNDIKEILPQKPRQK
uniref:Uncharacterized protein n=1 Tax=Cuerna arida TaxID=1464854 RepID=A0A1B6FBU8_9HEMI